MADQSVGFGFQADIVNTGSVAHLITGRVLKALSDGGVDLYAVTAVVWLGAKFSVRSDLESTVHSHIAAKKGYQSFVIKALSIGWGHSVVPVEMSRTKAGTNALLLIGALSTGSSYYFAGQCLSQLLSLWGCDPTSIPVVDRLRDMAAYLAPFVQDLGFSKVLEHVTTSTSHSLIRLCHDGSNELTTVGDAPILASAVKQLIFTSQRSETIYMIVKQRGAWLAAFASYILGMAVEILFGESVIWESGGSNGRASLQIRDEYVNSQALQQRMTPLITLVDEPSTDEGFQEVEIDYSLDQALEAELGKCYDLELDVIPAIHTAIAKLSFDLLRHTRMISAHHDKGHKIMGSFDGTAAMDEILIWLNLENNARRLGRAGTAGFEAWRNDMNDLGGLGIARRYLDSSIAQRIGQSLSKVSSVILGCATTALALVQCKFNASDIRINSSIISGRVRTPWTRNSIKADYPSSATYLSLLSHLSALLQVPPLGKLDEAILDGELGRPDSILEDLLGISGGSYTIIYTCLIEDEAFDNFGRLISIRTGRASFEGNLRQWIVEDGYDHYGLGDYFHRSDLTEITSGFLLEPQYRPSKLSVSMVAHLGDQKILIEATVDTDDNSRIINLTYCHSEFFRRAHTALPCMHDICRPFLIKPELSVRLVVTGFNPNLPSRPSGTTMVVALRGRRLEQLVQIAYSDSDNRFMLQIFSCFECSLDQVLSKGALQEQEDQWSIIMGG